MQIYALNVTIVCVNLWRRKYN